MCYELRFLFSEITFYVILKTPGSEFCKKLKSMISKTTLGQRPQVQCSFPANF